MLALAAAVSILKDLSNLFVQQFPIAGQKLR